MKQGSKKRIAGTREKKGAVGSVAPETVDARTPGEKGLQRKKSDGKRESFNKARKKVRT